MNDHDVAIPFQRDTVSQQGTAQPRCELGREIACLVGMGKHNPDRRYVFNGCRYGLDIPFRRVRLERGVLDGQHLSDRGRRELGGHTANSGTDNQHPRGLARLAANCCPAAIASHDARFSFPARCSAMMRMGPFVIVPRRSSRSLRRSSAATSAGEPANHLRALGLLRNRERKNALRRLEPGGHGHLTNLFFLAAMMPLSVAYRSWLIPL